MFRHGSLRDDRRRRSLLEDVNAAGEGSATAKARRTSKTTETYTDRARRECHPRWSDFVPRRNLTLAALGIAGLLAIAVLIAAYHFAVRSSLWSPGELRALDLFRADSLAGWFAALVTFLTAALSILIYTVRRYRLDDYRGRYRVWLAAAVMSLLMSMDVVADLRSMVRVLGITLTGRVGPGGGVAWWLAPWSLAVLWFGLRMVVDVRACRSAMAAFVLGFGGLIAGFVLPQTSFQVPGLEMMVISSGCSLIAYWLFFFAHVAFARHVLLDAHGQLPFREAKPRRKKAEPVTDEKAKPAAKTSAGALKGRDDLSGRIDPPHSPPYRAATSGIDVQRPQTQPAGQSKSQMSGPKATAAFATNGKPINSSARFTSANGKDADDDEPSDYRKLSRAERKRLRKQQRAERHADDD